ncbi:MAG TPA: thiamine pyrophosphate-dependent dehydrogenase E1 component subunit alpha [Candidatus Limnocylindria bacterium]
MAVTSRAPHEALGLSLDDVKQMYRHMLMTRMVSERILQLNRMGRTPFGAGTDGHEAAQVGAAWNIRRGKDWTVPYYRDMGVAFVLGMSPLEEFRMVLAKATDTHSAGRQVLNQFSSPRDRIVTRSVCVATEFPHAVGLALAVRNKKEDAIVFAFGGDASTSPGDFHEAANFAAVHRLPVVFVIENNLLAISTRFEQQMAVKNVADKASGYGMPGFIADGMDVIDSYAKTKEAVAYARSGQGPALVELKCYRFQPHTSDDDDTRYRTKEELREWLAKDPMDRARRYVLEQGVTEAELTEMRAALDQEIEAAIAQAESEPDPRPEDAARHVYAEDKPLPGGTRA